jgi:hypothetical protein
MTEAPRQSQNAGGTACATKTVVGQAVPPAQRRLAVSAQVLTLFLISLPAFSAVTGTVINRTTGLPQAGATVALNKLDQNGVELVDQAKSDAAGKFSINQTPQATPYLIRTAFDGITYNHMLQPGSPSTDLTLEVFNVSKQPGAAKISKHMLLFEPSGGQLTVNETFLFTNDGKTAWYDASNGTLRFFMPASAGGKATVQGTAPEGMPIAATAGKEDLDRQCLRGGFPRQAGRDAFRPQLHRALHRGRRRTRARSSPRTTTPTSSRPTA